MLVLFMVSYTSSSLPFRFPFSKKEDGVLYVLLLPIFALVNCLILGPRWASFPFCYDWRHSRRPYQCLLLPHQVCGCSRRLDLYPGNASSSNDHWRLCSPPWSFLVGMGFQVGYALASNHCRGSNGSWHHAHPRERLKLYCRRLQKKRQQCDSGEHIC